MAQTQTRQARKHAPPPPAKRGRGRPRKHPITAAKVAAKVPHRKNVSRSDEDLIGAPVNGTTARGGDGRALSRTDNHPPMEPPSVSAAQLKNFVSRIERMEAAKQEVADKIKEVWAEAKSAGFEVKIMRKVVSIRKRDREEITREEMVLNVYLNALGISIH